MKFIDKFVGGLYTLFGVIVAILDILDWVSIVKVFPQLPNIGAFVYGHIFVFFVGIGFAMFGRYMFTKS